VKDHQHLAALRAYSLAAQPEQIAPRKAKLAGV